MTQDNSDKLTRCHFYYRHSKHLKCTTENIHSPSAIMEKEHNVNFGYMHGKLFCLKHINNNGIATDLHTLDQAIH